MGCHQESYLLVWTVGFLTHRDVLDLIPIILPGMKRVFPQTWKLIFLIQIRTQIGHIESGGYPIVSVQFNLVGIRVNLFQYFERPIGSRELLGFPFAWKPFLSQMDPHEIPRLELDISPALVGLDLVVLIKLLNSSPYLGMEILNFFHPPVSLPTKLGAR